MINAEIGLGFAIIIGFLMGLMIAVKRVLMLEKRIFLIDKKIERLLERTEIEQGVTQRMKKD